MAIPREYIPGCTYFGNWIKTDTTMAGSRQPETPDVGDTYFLCLKARWNQKMSGGYWLYDFAHWKENEYKPKISREIGRYQISMVRAVTDGPQAKLGKILYG